MWENREDMNEHQNPGGWCSAAVKVVSLAKATWCPGPTTATEMLKVYLNAHAHLPDNTRLNDFHLLVYLAQLFDLEVRA